MSHLQSLLSPFRTLINLHTNTTTYRSLLSRSAKSILTLLALYYFLLALAATAAYQLFTLPDWEKQLNQTWDELRINWPEDLVVEYRDGRLTAAPSTALTVGYPSVLSRTEGLPTELLTLDTNAESHPDHSNALLHFSASALTVYQGETSKTESYAQLLPNETFAIDRTALEQANTSMRQRIHETLELFTPLVGLQTFVLLPLVRLLLLVPFAWFGLALLQVTGNRLRYRRAYTLGALLLPVAETTQFLLSHLYPQLQLNIFWWIWMALLLLVSWLNRGQLRPQIA